MDIAPLVSAPEVMVTTPPVPAAEPPVRLREAPSPDLLTPTDSSTVPATVALSPVPSDKLPDERFVEVPVERATLPVEAMADDADWMCTVPLGSVAMLEAPETMFTLPAMPEDAAPAAMETLPPDPPEPATTAMLPAAKEDAALKVGQQKVQS